MSNKMTTALLLASALWIVPAAAQTTTGGAATAGATGEQQLPAAPAQGAMLEGAIAGTVTAAQLSGLEGKMVEGSKGKMIGTIIAADQKDETIELQSAKNMTVSMPSALLYLDGEKVTAPTTSAPDIVAMAATQAAAARVAFDVPR